MGMKLAEAIKKYFGKYDDTEDETEGIKKPVYKAKKKKKKKTPAGSYFKKKRKGYEKMLEDAGDY